MTNVRIIDGKRYNIDTATRVAHYWNGLSNSDFRNVSETLYRTPKGNWFLIGSGGALSKYARSCGNNATCGGTEWLTLSNSDVFEWLQEHHETDALETHFADRIQNA